MTSFGGLWPNTNTWNMGSTHARSDNAPFIMFLDFLNSRWSAMKSSAPIDLSRQELDIFFKHQII